MCGACLLTVDGDGDGLVEDEAVGALEGRDTAKLVELEVLGRDTVGGLRVDELDIEVVLLRNGEEAGCAGVALRASMSVDGRRKNWTEHTLKL